MVALTVVPVPIWAAAVVAALSWLGLVLLLRGSRLMVHLTDVAPVAPAQAPPVSVIVAARNEAHAVEAAVRSLLAQHYPGLEVVVVDDRSEDETGAILDRMAAACAALRVVHVRDLPTGWLGKNHALHVGAAGATGEFLLFADADVVLAPSAVARAVGRALAAGRDHVAVAPTVIARGAALQAFIGAFAYFFTVYTRPWAAPNPHDPAFIGIGAFNMVRAAVYHAHGGHAPIRLRPDDDIMLGKWLKRHGARQELLVGGPLVVVEWYPSLRALVDGLMKNTFAGLHYSVVLTLGAVLAQLLFLVAPWVLLPFTRGTAQLGLAAAAAATLASAALSARSTGAPLWTALFLPLSSLGFCYILLRAMVLTLGRGGIRWRGTFYPLRALRENRV